MRGLYAGSMSIAKRVGQNISRNLAPKVTKVAPQVTAGFVQQALDRAIRGVGPLDGAAMVAEKQHDEQKGDDAKAIKQIIENHVRLAGAQGFLTNIGGLVTMPVAVPDQHRRAGADPVPDGGGDPAPARLRPRRTRASATASWPPCWARSGCCP